MILMKFDEKYASCNGVYKPAQPAYILASAERDSSVSNIKTQTTLQKYIKDLTK